MSGRLLVVRTGSTLPEIAARRGDFAEWIGLGMGVPAANRKCVSPFEGEALPDPHEFAAVVVTGSSAMVSDRAGWSERTAQWLSRVLEAGTPLLAICYGHQLLAHALGGEVGPNPKGREIGTIEVLADPGSRDPLLEGLPQRALFHATHCESVLRLPDGVASLAHSALDPHQAFAVGNRSWGVQFHPEFDADVMRQYLAARREILGQEGIDAEALLAATHDSGDGQRLLRRFAAIAGLS